MKRAGLTALFAVLVLLSGKFTAFAKVYAIKDEALKRAFPSAEIGKMSVFLTPEELNKAEELSGTRPDSKLFSYYVANEDGRAAGYAIIGSHIVRTKPEAYMAVLNPDRTIRYIEILAFYEPEEYLPPKRWLAQFTGKRLGEGLWVNRDIQAITGATITTYSLTREVRKALALFEMKAKEGR